MLPLSKKMFASFLMLSSTLDLSACATPPASSDACAWLKQIVPDANFQSRWTTNEKAQVLAFDQIVEKECRKQ